MTNVRRCSSPSLALFALAVFASGCAGSGPYSAGRLPYDTQIAGHDPFAGATKNKVTSGANDASNGAGPRTANAAPPQSNGPLTAWNPPPEQVAGEDYSAPPGPNSTWRRETAPANVHQAAYFEPTADDNPFALPRATTSDGGGYATAAPASEPAPYPPASSYPVASYPAPTTSNPTTESIEQVHYEMPATAVSQPNPFAEVQGQPPMMAATQQPMSYSAPVSYHPRGAWQPETTAQMPASEEFLPPIR